MRIGVVGGGVAGLGCAYFLSQRGHQVEVFEQAPSLGGLAGSFDFDGLNVEKYYHFVCRDDVDLIDLLARLGLTDELEWRAGRMKFFCRGRLYPFGTSWDLLRFRPLSMAGRIRFGLNVALSRSAKSWERYESTTAREWLISQIGQQPYEVIWEPLLRIKFGSYYDQISASWIWHRINRVARSRPHIFARERLGYLKRGTQALLDTLVATLRRHGVGLHTAVSVDGITVGANGVTGLTVSGQHRPFDRVVSTVPLPILARLLPPDAVGRLGDIRSIDYIAVLCLILKLRQPVTDAFWINVNDERTPFNGFIEYTNLNPRVDASHPHILYVPFYLPPGHARFAQPDAELFGDCLAGLRVVRPDLNQDWVLGYRVFRDRFAQAICTTNFARRVPPVRAGIAGLFLTDSTQLYPSDRTISGMFGQAKKVADLIEEAA
ncbi:MAG TPA: NAD(P)/FAD-dependent oxidoreductase [Candidatus Polarisedimenticolia bacterium]|nr:NAD(P)/FAD-dependent oxidoreductase [Candidatus Polarisedimenticolia bacterium]